MSKENLFSNKVKDFTLITKLLVDKEMLTEIPVGYLTSFVLDDLASGNLSCKDEPTHRVLLTLIAKLILIDKEYQQTAGKELEKIMNKIKENKNAN